MEGFVKKPGRCSAPMWCMGLPAGLCGATAYGVQIEGRKVRFGNEVRRLDGKYDGFVSGLACPKHAGPEKTGPRVFEDGTDGEGRRMWCAVYEDFENLQESPAEFHINAWVAVERLLKNYPRPCVSRQ